jgi:plasmid stabilization system protein ParE
MRGRYRIEWLEPAKQDLREIIFYLLDKAPLVALGVQEQFEQQLTSLEEFPRICQKNAYFPEILDFKIKGLPYIVVYKVFPKKICY